MTTTIPTTLLTLAEVQAEALRVVEQFGPERRNPGWEYGCKYTNEYGHHCIAGQIISNLGRPIPEEDHPDNEEVVNAVSMFERHVEPEALDWLALVQADADEGCTWAESVSSAIDLAG